jgi:hypothetical protein
MDKSKSSDHSIFAKRQGGIKLSTESENNNISENTSLFGKIKGYMNLSSDEEAQTKIEDNLSFFQKFVLKLKSTFEVEKSYTLFFIFLATGIGLLFLSLAFLPIAWLSPQKFVSLLSLGSLTILISFVFIYGTSAYCEMLFTKTRALFSFLFICSTFLGIYFCFFNHSYYIVALVCALVQFITLIIFTLSFIPGGSMGISFITSILMSPIYSLWGKLSGK